MSQAAYRNLGARGGALSSVSLRDQARSVLRAGIVAGDFEPGELYSIPAVAARLEVSVTPIREALLDLANDGLVEMVRNRGFRVTQLSPHDLAELVQLRLFVEVDAVALIAELPERPSLQHLRELSLEIKECADRGDVLGFLQLDREFHLALLALLGNRRLVELIGRLRDETRLYGLKQVTLSGQMMPSLREHDRLLDAIERADAATAADIMRQHLEHARGIWAGHREPASEGGVPVGDGHVMRPSPDGHKPR